MRAHGRSGCSGPRGIGEYLGWCSPWTKESSYFAAPAARAHQTVRFGLLWITVEMWIRCEHFLQVPARTQRSADRKSTRLNSSHLVISYAVFCLKKKKISITWIWYT